ncbi:hypothetical protein PsalMR5_03090 [Piscirickettsia salmonis]|nr:hypothetical protein PsalSR1_03084 [Piscirickettsia salmonis]QGP58517.1 hypothetical protein PsalBI1_01088 [Piscirickettsia salmonis]QGP65201.1 hypothetical protein PsalMR5_03090 [Piscirickettsia salmonis]
MKINHQPGGIMLIMNNHGEVMTSYSHMMSFFSNYGEKVKIENQRILNDNKLLFSNRMGEVRYRPCLIIDAKDAFSVCSGVFHQVKNEFGVVVASSLNVMIYDYKSMSDEDIIHILKSVKKHPKLSLIESKILFLKVVMKGIKCRHIESLLKVSGSTVYTYCMNIKSKANIFSFKGQSVIQELEKSQFFSDIAMKINIDFYSINNEANEKNVCQVYSLA